MDTLQVTDLKSIKLAVIGLGYVGLPLAVAFGKTYETWGYDISTSRIDALKKGKDSTQEVPDDALKSAVELHYTDKLDDIKHCNVYIIAVPTPIDASNQPDLTPLLSASHDIGLLLTKGDLVIYESTVYPGTTEEDCVPVLESTSGLVLHKDFFVGYSPERINPGDKGRPLTSIVKITSGSCKATANTVDALYSSVITAGTYKAPSIRVAEAAKVIENTQRDVNIALVNELALICNKLNIDTEEVLKAAGTKWNFLPFRPGLVGGHCIGVDPYYLAHKAEAVGYHPDVIMAARRLNDGMGVYVANQLMRAMIKKQIDISQSNVLIMGLAFKENCPDLRNTRVVDIYKELSQFCAKVDVYDPWVDRSEAQNSLGITLVSDLAMSHYDAVIVAVAHDEFRAMNIDEVRAYCKPVSLVYDLKYVFQLDGVTIRL